jgi:hypothetical protein
MKLFFTLASTLLVGSIVHLRRRRRNAVEDLLMAEADTKSLTMVVNFSEPTGPRCWMKTHAGFWS